MAEIQKRTETVVKNFYRLDLSQEEAEVIVSVLSLVGGSTEGYRGVTSEILYKLEDAGVDWSDTEVHRKLSGRLNFQDTK